MSYNHDESLENVCCQSCKKILVIVLQNEALLLHVPIDSKQGTQELVLNPEDITVVKKSPEAPQLIGEHIGKHKC